MNAKVRTCLWFEKGVEEAVRLYVSLLPDSRIEQVVTYDHLLGPPHGDVKVIDFTLAGTAYQAMEAGPHEYFNDAMSISVATGDQDETDRLWTALTADGGRPVQCGWLKDRWGVSWQIVPKRLFEMTADTDKAAARRALFAMLEMQKIDIAELERAFHGQA